MGDNPTLTSTYINAFVTDIIDMNIDMNKVT